MEIEVLKKELEKEANFNNNSYTRRFSIVTVCLFTICLVLLTIYLISKRNQKTREIIFHSSKFLGLLKKFNGDKSVFQDEIEKESDKNLKEIKQKALEVAEKEYQRTKDFKSIEEYKKDFESLYPKKNFNNWNLNIKDKELLIGVCNNFFENIREYLVKGADLFLSKKNRSEAESNQIDDLLKNQATFLENLSSQVKRLKFQNNYLKDSLEQIRNQYREVAKKFKKGKF